MVVLPFSPKAAQTGPALMALQISTHWIQGSAFPLLQEMEIIGDVN